jgi:PAS domain S-box-containing protein
MNLRTRGLILSVLPLAIILGLAIPEIFVLVSANRADTRAIRSDFLSEVARQVEESALDVRRAVRSAGRGVPGALTEYPTAVHQVRASADHLTVLSLGDVQTREQAARVRADVDAVLRIIELSVLETNRRRYGTAFAVATGVQADQGVFRLRRDVAAFDSTAHRHELEALAALDRSWKLSITLLALAVGALIIATAILAYYSDRATRAILELGRKGERYRSGGALGPPSRRRDEIGLLDRAVHEFVAVQDARERELRRYRLLADVTHDIILFIDRRDLTVIDVNAAALAAYGYERGDLIGKPTAVLHAVEDPIDIETIALSDTPAGLSYEGLHQKFDGTVFPVEVHARTAEVDGKLTIIKTIRDISERRYAAGQVALALDQAIEASRLKTEFVATMSHELRTPMYGVIGMSELLLETELQPVQREYAATVKESAQALLGIVDDILDFSKLEARKIDLEAVAFDPVQLVASVISLVRGTARDKGLTLRSYALRGVPRTVRGDPTRLRQVLMNLVGNAVKFTPEGTVSVSLSVERDDGTAVVLDFAVSDTGIGVAHEARERLFDAFVQGDGTTTRRFGGTGLGLSISRRLAELMGGRIWVEDREGPGSTFHFTARVERADEVIEPVDLGAGTLRVLVVDHEEPSRRALQATLTSWGMHGSSVPGAEAAKEHLREAASSGKPVDIVLIDDVLPCSDALAFANGLRTHPEYGAPACALIASVDAVDQEEAARAAGCIAYLRKPVDASELYDVLSSIERARKVQSTSANDPMRPASILLAEDSALIRRVARHQLAELEQTVDVVENGTQAVAAVASGNYELVLMDMRMPEMDGLAATRAIRSVERENGRRVVIIALTANAMEGDRDACLEAGMDDFLAKPLRLDTLRAMLDRWLPERLTRA